MIISLKRIGAASWLALIALGGCGNGPPEHRFNPTGDLSAFGALPSETAADAGKRYYRDGAYGLAEKSFRKAVEEDPNNTEAWLGLAASYDRLKRFDLADRAYEVVIKQVGYTPTVLNNLGYHQLLRGDRKAAERNLTAALSGDPESPVIHNNLLIVDDPDHAPDHWNGAVVRR
jgi:Flp pilus assembly protein TadD